MSVAPRAIEVPGPGAGPCSTPACMSGQLTNISDTDPATGLTTTTLVASHDRDTQTYYANLHGPAVPPGDPPSTATVTAVSPTSVPAGGPNQQLTVTGTGFTATTVIVVNGTGQSTTFDSATQVHTTANYFPLGPGTVQVGVDNPGELPSNTVPLLVTP